MTTQQLIYETAVPVNSGQHANHCVEVGPDYSFASKLNSAPLMAVEFPQAASEYAIVFAGNSESVTSAVILGVRDDENLFLSDKGEWHADYIPAFVRRYPFVFSNSEDGSTFTLCIDETFKGLNTEGRGQPLFTEDGKNSSYVDGVLSFLQEYRGQHMLTQAFCNKLIELNLLEPMEAQFTIGADQKMMLNGFMAVSREKLNALPGEVLSELAKTDQLELIYIHLQSMRNFNGVKNLLVSAQGNLDAAESKPEKTNGGPKKKAKKSEQEEI